MMQNLLGANHGRLKLNIHVYYDMQYFSESSLSGKRYRCMWACSSGTSFTCFARWQLMSTKKSKKFESMSTIIIPIIKQYYWVNVYNYNTNNKTILLSQCLQL
jgi:hypothetical protein